MEDNKLLVRRFFEELWNERKLELAEALFDEACETNQLHSGAQTIPQPRGPAAIGDHVAEWISSFPDIRVTVEQMFADGDRVLSQVAMDGTHKGQWLGIPPTGRRVNIRMVAIHRVQNDKIIQDWVLVDFLGLLQQFGALPATTDILAEFARRERASDPCIA